MKQAVFEAWCSAQGISSPLKLQGADTNYRYLTSPTTDITGDLLQVPLKACITADTPESLAERLVFEKSLGDDSDFGPFISMFPTLDDLQAMPRFWNSPDRLDKVMDGGQLQQRIQQSIRKELDPWAYACVNSRANYLPDLSFALTPVLDMLNHDPTVGTKARISDNDELVLTVDKTFAADTEVFISYGDLTNLDTLSDYGFVSENNPCNAESFVVRMLRQPPVGVIVDPDGNVNIDAIAKLRENVANMYGVETDGGLFLEPISDSNEDEVYSLVATFMQEAIDEATIGAQQAKGDDLVNRYLVERAKTLKKGISMIEAKFPELEY